MFGYRPLSSISESMIITFSSGYHTSSSSVTVEILVRSTIKMQIITTTDIAKKELHVDLIKCALMNSLPQVLVTVFVEPALRLPRRLAYYNRCKQWQKLSWAY